MEEAVRMTTLQDGVDGGIPLDSYERSFPDSLTAVAEARHFVTDALTRWNITKPADDIRLCVSEMATNALVHAASPDRGFTLRVFAWAHRLRVEVDDRGTGRPVRRTARWEDTSGRGLLLVEALSDDWGVLESEGGKTVWSEFRLGSGDSPSIEAVAC